MREPERDERTAADAPVDEQTAQANTVVPVPPAMTPEELEVRADAVDAIRDRDATGDTTPPKRQRNDDVNTDPLL